VDRDSVRAYLDRDWSAGERLEREHWAALWRTLGPAANLRAARTLYEHVRRMRPEWPSEAERAADLAHHVALKRRLDLAARALTAR
jgi:hypothetical protein